MDMAKRLKEKLDSYSTAQQGDRRISGWYFELLDTQAINVGIKDNVIGGSYNCPNYKDECSGQLYIIWGDNKRTKTKIDRQTLDNLDSLIDLWRRASFVDNNGPDILAPQNLPTVKLLDHNVKDIVTGNNAIAFDILGKYISHSSKSSVQNINASVSASYSQRMVYNSRGLEWYNDQSRFSTSLWADNAYYNGFNKRRLAEPGEIDYIIQDVLETTPKLKNKINWSADQLDIVLTPGVSQSFIDKYILANVMGENVTNRQSCYNIDDFKNNKAIARKDIDIEIDTLRDYESGSYVCTSEGVPGGRVKLISQGQLQTPILNLKYSKLIGLNPTPMPSGGNVYIKGDMMDYQDMIKEIERGIIVYDILGMHTQDSVSGNYSLTTAHSLVVEKGEVLGSIKGVISGNFLEAIRGKDIKMAKIQHKEAPAIKIKGNITIER